MNRSLRMHRGRKKRQERRGEVAVVRAASIEDMSTTIIVGNLMGVFVDHEVTGDGIPADTTVVSINEETNEVEISNAATATDEAAIITFTPPG